MDTINLAFVYNRKNHLNKQGEALIQMRVTYMYKSYFMSTGIYVTPKQWNNKKEEVKNHPNLVRLNFILTDLKNKARKFQSHQDKFDPKALMHHLRGVPNPEENAIKFFTDKYEEEDKNTRRKKQDALSVNTLKQHKLLLMYLKRYNSSLAFKDINYDFKGEFESWLLDQESKRGTGKLSRNYVSLLLRILKGYTNKAIKSKKLHDNPFLGERIQTEETDKDYLNTEELSRIEGLDLSQRRGYVAESKDVFLFTCYTGLRFGDAMRLKRHHFRNDDEGIRMSVVLEKTKKKKIKIDLPLYSLFSGKPEQLVKKYLEEDRLYDNLFGPYAKNHLRSYNDHLKDFGRITGIDKNFSSHMGRHTCAMIMLNEQGYPFETVQAVLGHASIATTQKHYAKMLTRGLDDRLKNGFL